MRLLHPFVEKLRQEAAEIERRGPVLMDGATVLRSIADELELFECAKSLESLSLRDAAAESGYSESHLSRLLAEGKLANAGKKGAPRIRRQDLGKKPQRPDGVEPDLVSRVLGSSPTD
jgi:hypothetical protein